MLPLRFAPCLAPLLLTLLNEACANLLVLFHRFQHRLLHRGSSPSDLIVKLVHQLPNPIIRPFLLPQQRFAIQFSFAFQSEQ